MLDDHVSVGVGRCWCKDAEASQERLDHEPMPYIDREYQRNAILAVEHALGQGRREILVAMATGTGKTRTCIGLCYRLLKTGRVRRILFLVDRLALDRGEFQAQAGGFIRLNKVFDGKLEQLIGDLADEVWRDAG